MIHLFTGLPGASKTLNTIKYISEKSDWADRPVFYHNIKKLKLDWKQIDEDQALKWFDLPEGSIIVFDECQDLFPVRTARKDKPEHISMLNKHRHRGYDIFFITQDPKDLDVGLRRQVEVHIHIKRIWGSNKINWQQFDACCENLNDYHALQKANSSVKTIDKKYFGAYHSAEIHTVQSRVPKGKMALLIGSAVVLVACIILGLSTIAGFGESNDELLSDLSGGQEEGASSTFSRPFSGDKDSLDLHLFKPRIEGLAFTAPAYDKARPINSAPTPNACILHIKQNDCKCYTRQATPLDIPTDVCNSIVDGGWFDHSFQHVSDAEAERRREPAKRAEIERFSERSHESLGRRSWVINEGDWIL